MFFTTRMWKASSLSLNCWSKIVILNIFGICKNALLQKVFVIKPPQGLLSTDKSRTMPTARTLLSAGLALGAIAYAQVCPITSTESERERERERALSNPRV